MGYRFSELREGLTLVEQSQQSLPSLVAVIQILRNELLPRLRDGEENTEGISYILSLQHIIEESAEAITRNFAAHFRQPQRVLTLSRSGTVISALTALAETEMLARVFVCESRPMNEGVKTARDLASKNIPVTLLVDSAMSEAIKHVDCAVTGADCISADGFLLNKTGTLLLAMLAKEKGIPFYVVCDSLKFSPQLRENIYVEDQDEAEVADVSDVEGITVWNRYFEWVPVDMVKEFITEQGVLRPDQLSALAGE